MLACVQASSLVLMNRASICFSTLNPNKGDVTNLWIYGGVSSPSYPNLGSPIPRILLL